MTFHLILLNAHITSHVYNMLHVIMLFYLLYYYCICAQVPRNFWMEPSTPFLATRRPSWRCTGPYSGSTGSPSSSYKCCKWWVCSRGITSTSILLLRRVNLSWMLDALLLLCRITSMSSTWRSTPRVGWSARGLSIRAAQTNLRSDYLAWLD